MYRGGWFPVNPVTPAVIMLLFVLGAAGTATGQSTDSLDGSRKEEALLARAIALVEAGDLDGAEDLMDGAGGIAGRDPRWLNLRGLVEAGRGRHREAVEQYEAGLRSDPLMAALHRNLAISLVALRARGRAMTEFLQATELSPTDTEAWLGLCHLQTELRRYRDAAVSLDRLEVLAPEDPRTGWARAELADENGDRSEQLAAWTWLEERVPDSETARRLGGLSEQSADQLRYLGLCVERDSSAVDCREQFTRLAFMEGDAAAAVAASEPALMDLSEPGYLNLLVAANSSGIPDIEAWVGRREPTLPASWLVIASTRRERDDPDGAMDAVQKGLGLAETADLYNLLGVLEVEAGDRDAARRAWQRALEIDPGFGPAKANLDEHPPGP